ncbi:MAG TPA: diaminobutyrate--2-oxoglutarate transaminase [Thermoanaerobaculia bacterium]|nr:diaminobutyrate--2-oxoglutarate transaminase [Thermoanaerobaculia bacterium]
MEIFDRLESEVRSYCRSFPTVFDRASGSHLYDQAGREYLDFFAGAGALNYGHNNPLFKERLIAYVQGDGVAHSLDMATAAKGAFLGRFHDVVLEPRGLRYKVQFPGPTGTNAVEAALKLARKVTGRKQVLYFHNAYHGMTLGALAVTGNAAKRRGAGVPLSFTTPLPYDGSATVPDSLAYLAEVLDNSSSGVDLPAAVIVESVQAEGGVNAASFGWLRRLADLLKRHGILLILDDIQTGCGRTGTFFSFEPAGIQPDLVCLSKSISGFGLPMALVLIKPELDIWSPGEHNGTFRGNNLAFVTGAAALDYWQDDTLAQAVARKSEIARGRLQALADAFPALGGEVRGRGLILGLRFADPDLAGQVSQAAFRRGLIVETAGPRDEVLKLLPPLVITEDELRQGLDIIESALDEVAASVQMLEVAV